MPEPALFLEGFNIHPGMMINGYELANITISHIAIKRYNEYEYPIKLDFNWVRSDTATRSDLDNLWKDLANLITHIRVIRTPSNRPYECSFFWPLDSIANFERDDNYREVDFMFTGYAKRIPESEVDKVNSGIWY